MLGQRDVPYCPKVGHRDVPYCPKVGQKGTSLCLKMGQKGTSLCLKKTVDTAERVGYIIQVRLCVVPVFFCMRMYLPIAPAGHFI